MAGSKSRWVAVIAPAGGTPGAHTHPEGDLPDATTTAQGVVELATSAETTTGTDTTRATTPEGVKAVADLKVSKAGAETITGTKTLDTPLVNTQVSTPSTPPSGKSTGPYFKANGLPYYLNASGIEVQFNVGDVVAALHANADFEAETAGVPDTWDLFLQTNGVTTSSTVEVFAGSRSALVTLSAAGNQALISDTLTVTPSDVINFSIYAKKGTGSPTISLTLLTKASGTPAFFDADTTVQSTANITLSSTYTKYAQPFSVPVGHTVARLAYSVAAGAAATAYVDNSASSKTVATAAALESTQVAQSAAVTPNGTTNSTLTGLSLSVTSPGTAAVYMVEIDADVTFAGAQTNIIELLVDGAAQTPQLISGAAATGYRIDGHKKWRVTGLAAGSRTFTARTRNSAAGTNVTVNLTHTLMTVTRVS